MIESREIPGSLKTQVLGFYKDLSRRQGMENPAVSVRSAGTESRPGMFKTYLNVRGESKRYLTHLFYYKYLFSLQPECPLGCPNVTFSLRVRGKGHPKGHSLDRVDSVILTEIHPFKR